jgi:cytochrome c biogenesis protein CcmG, thiol:disulfide interchange protein DsbE
MNWKRSVIGAGIALAVVSLLAYGLTQDPRELPNALPGNHAPAFTLPVMDSPGDTVSLAEYRGKVLVLNFWASWCAECRVEHPVLTEAALAYKGRVDFYGVLWDDTPEKGRAWIQDVGGQVYPNLLDDNGLMAVDYGLTGVPETVIIGPDGKVAHKQIGVVTPELMRTKLDSLLAVK